MSDGLMLSSYLGSNNIVSAKASVGHKMFTNEWEYSIDTMKAYAREAYGGNPTVFSCISLVADAFGAVPLKVKVGDEYKDDHPLQILLDNPNPDEGGVEFRTAAASWIQLTGNCFTERINVVNDKFELWNWQPFEMSIGYAKGKRLPKAYAYNKNSESRQFWDIDEITGRSDMLHWRKFNPSPNANGMGQSSLMAGGSAVDQSNAADKWRYNTFKNNAAPSGILSTEQDVSETKRKGLESSIKRKHQGVNNARDIMLLGGGLTWQQVSMSAQDMDWLDGSKMLDQKICALFRVPTQMLGIEGSQTYANYAEAKVALYTEAVLPLLKLYISELNRFFKFDFPEATICFNEDDIPALEPLRQARRSELKDANFISKNEKRAMYGFPKYDANEVDTEADEIFSAPDEIPLGAGIIDDDERDLNQAAKSLMRIKGIPFDEAYQEVFDMKQDADESKL